MDKAQSVDALRDWARRAEKLRAEANADLPAPEYVVEHKFDGLTINLTYENGQLVGAATRGNGVVGEEILPQVRTIRSVPLSIPFQGRMEVHGEGFMRISTLEAYNQNRQGAAQKPAQRRRRRAAQPRPRRHRRAPPGRVLLRRGIYRRKSLRQSAGNDGLSA